MTACEIICLANSRKHAGRCVAGLRTDGLGWVRPVGPGPGGVLFPWHDTLPDETEARLLDVLSVDLIGPQPEPHQPENCLVAETPWQLVSRPAPKHHRPVIRPHVARGPDLLGQPGDRVPFGAFREAPATASLALILPENVTWEIGRTRQGGRQTRVRFTLAGAPYDLSVSDPAWERRLAGLAAGHHPITAAGLTDTDRLLFTISLGEPFLDFCYKLVAAVIVLPRDWLRR